MLYQFDEINPPYFTGGTAAGSNSAANFWHKWSKPAWARAVHIVAIGAGSGGGKGFAAAATNPRGGGQGGGGGGISRAVFMAKLLPDVLWIQTPLGGKGAGATAGVVGGRAIVAIDQTLSSQAWILVSSTDESPVGANGSSSGSASAAGGTTAATATTAKLTCLAESFISIGGVVGSSGGSPANAGQSAGLLASGTICSGGAGGGGVTTTEGAGGGVTGVSIFPTLNGGTVGGGEGQGNFIVRQPFVPYPGAGGGGNNNATGGRGGDGAYGCGGGGGGGGVTAGDGGRGGDAIVWIISV